MGLNPLIIFMHLLNESFSSLFKRFKPHQDHIFVSVLFIVGFSRYTSRNGHKASLFNRVFNWVISKFCVFLCPLTARFLKTKVFLGIIVTGYLIPVVCWSLSFKLWAIIGWKTFLVSLFSGHCNFTGRRRSDVIMAKIIGCALSYLPRQSWPLPPAPYWKFRSLSNCWPLKYKICQAFCLETRDWCEFLERNNTSLMDNR